ncbi:MAG: helix-turn-helix transcriptional regulator [Trichlorobacter sp.]|jgi:transcriptional regulator with XRE-family HTH domain|nr:helix-turn-helix transcriptional regulator [Trichlorobacter sp.]
MREILTSWQIGERLRGFRKRRGLTQEQLAEKVGVSFQQIQQYENGSSRLNADRLQQVALALDIPVGSLFDDSDGRSLTEDEIRLVSSYRALENAEIQAFMLFSITQAGKFRNNR